MKLSTEGSVGDRRQVSQATEIATTVPEAIFAAIGSSALLGYGLVTGKIHLSKK